MLICVVFLTAKLSQETSYANINWFTSPLAVALRNSDRAGNLDFFKATKSVRKILESTVRFDLSPGLPV